MTWSSTNQDAGSLVSVFHRNDVAAWRTNNGVMRLIAKKPGRIVVKLRAKITKAMSASDQFQLDRDRELTDQLEIVVFEDLRLTTPSLPANTLLMTPNSEFQLRTNRDSAADVTYRIVEEDAAKISVSRGGLVRTGAQPGTAVVHVEEKEDFGLTQTLSVVVDVKPVSYAMLNVGAVFAPLNRAQLGHLPRGLELPMHVSLHDSTGLRFDAADVALTYRPSRFDTLLLTEGGGADNHTLRAELLREQMTVLRVAGAAGAAGGPDLNDFVIFHVGRGVTPDLRRRNVIVGDVVDLDNLVKSPSDENADDAGRWTAEPEGMASIDPATGLATMLRSGHVRFSHFLDDKQRTSLDLEIRPCAKISFGKNTPDLMLTTDPKPQLVPFIVQSEQGGETGNFHGAARRHALDEEDDEEDVKSRLFDCHAHFTSKSPDPKLQDLFDIDTVFSHRLSSYACKFSPKQALFLPKSALLADDIQLHVSPAYQSYLTISTPDPTSVRFVSGFHVAPPASVELSNAEQTQRLSVHGLSSVLRSVQAEVSHEQFLQLGRDFLDGQGDTVKQIPVKLRPAYWREARPRDDLYVTLTSPLTLQSVRVPVSVSLAGDHCANADLNWGSLAYFVVVHYQSVIMLVACCVVCILITWGLLKMQLQQQQQQLKQLPPGFAKGSSASNGGTPRQLLARSPLLEEPQSPQSPLLTNAENRPYLWTVDSSPCYGSPPGGANTSGSRRSPRPLTQYSYTDL